MTNSHRLTLRDIAKQAGVSYQTVSRVINNHPYVAEETRQRVSDIIAELDYHPNKAARSLAGHRANTIALVASGTAIRQNTWNQFAPSIIADSSISLGIARKA